MDRAAWWKNAMNKISTLPADMAFELIHGYSLEKKEEYQGVKFETDLFLAQELVLKNGLFELYEDENSWSPSKLFIDTFIEKAEESYDASFWDGYGALQYDLPEYKLRLRVINGQGTVKYLSSTAE